VDEGTMESGVLLPGGDCVAGRGALVPSGAADLIVTVRIFFGPVAAGTAGVAVETDGAAAGGKA
jgi:hypothetical protein